MNTISPLRFHRTSLSLRPRIYRKARAALLILRRNGVVWSESELFSRIAKVYLQRWRGNGLKSATSRRYNARISSQAYVVRPWCVDQMLYASLWERTVHSGQSVSRLVDFALRNFLRSFLESILRTPMPRHARAQRNAEYWRARYAQRRRTFPDLFINYSCVTRENAKGNLEYVQRIEIIPKTGLSPGDILYLMRHTA